MQLKYYHNLDGVRGIAAMMVVVFHFFTYPNSIHLSNITLYQKLTEVGQHGVSLFFVLSGFVITRILINTRGQQNYFKKFYYHRLLRIMPLYYTFLLIYYFFTPIIFQTNFIDFKLQFPYYIFLQNFTQLFNMNASGPGHFWSLAVEEHFYLLWPVVIFFIRPNKLWKIIFSIVVVVFFVKISMLKNGMSINQFTFSRIDQILMGAYLATLEYEGILNKKNSVNIFLLLGFTVFILSGFIYLFQNEIPLMKEIMKYFLLGLFFLSIIGIIISRSENNLLNRVLSGRFLNYLGKISYGIYVWHILILMLLNKLYISNILLVDLILTIILTIIFSHVSYFYYERIFLSLKERLVIRTGNVYNTNHSS